MSYLFALEADANGEVFDVYSAARPDRRAVLANTLGPSLTRQEFVDECDINNILRGYENGKAWPGMLPGVEPVYFDFTSVPGNLQDAMHQMQSAADAFMMLHANVRREFDNDPVKFVDFASRPDSLGKLREWGLAPPAPEPPAAAPGPAPAAPAAPAAGS